MAERKPIWITVLWCILAAAAMGGLAYLGHDKNTYLLFHTMVEMFSIAVSIAIYLVAWNVRKRMANDFLMFVAIAYAAASLLDLIHTIVYPGMSVVPGLSMDPPTQFWIAARYLQAICLLIAPIWLSRRMPLAATMFVMVLVDAAVILTIFWPSHWDWMPAFPVTHMGPVLGQTIFKVVSEYIICGILLVAIIVLWLRRRLLDKAVLLYMTASMALTMVSELFFTTYVNVYESSNMIGHLFKVAAVYLAYKALVNAGLMRPFEVLFRDVADSEHRLRSILDTLPVGIFLSDPAGNVIFTNPATEKIWGISTHVSRDRYGEYKGRWFKTRQPVQPEEWALARALDTRAPYENELVELDFPGGKTKIIHNFAIPIQGEAGQFLGVVVVTEDVSIRTRAQEQIKAAKEAAEQSAADLARSNSDLEQFAYVASHDLQEPLRMVTGFMQLFEKKYQGKLDSTADTYIHYAVDGAKRMQQLIEDLLTYSRAGTLAKEPSPVDSAQALEQAIANLHVSIAESSAEIAHGPLPTVNTDGAQLVQVFQNLIGNAIKFRGDQQPKIRVEAREDADKWEFSISDNGIGIEPEFYDKIFVIFQRLHTKDKYSGTGIGLAICKKIIERRGGRIWLQSTPGEGSTFYFTILK